MSKQAEAVKRWRDNCKQRMLQAMGNTCQICGYDKCPTALEFHHLDLKEKDFAFGASRANPKKWEAIVTELRKCILLCVNCHREVHAGITNIPDTFVRFDENYADYRATIREKKKRTCPVCLQVKHFTGVTCSMTCVSSRKSIVDWETYNPTTLREQGYSNVAIAEMAGCSETAVRKRIKKLQTIPV